MTEHRHFWQIMFRKFNVHAGRGWDRGWYEFYCTKSQCHEKHSIAVDKFWGSPRTYDNMAGNIFPASKYNITRINSPHTHGGTDAPECTPYGQLCRQVDSLGKSNTELMLEKARENRRIRPGAKLRVVEVSAVADDPWDAQRKPGSQND